jgi:hypothetical protein
VKETLAQYQAWNDAEQRDKFRNAGKKTSEQKWQEYLDIMELGMAIKPEPSLHEHRQKITVLNHYYEKIQTFEKRRAHHTK